MSKDPAFLFYSKDWLEGTAELSAQEKGVYIDLLAHQHQKGSLPPEIKKLSKLAGLSEPEFLEIWTELEPKFIPNGSGRLVNRKLNGIVTERLDKGHRNTIIGTLASVIRHSTVPYELSAKAKKTFKVDDFLPIAKENLTVAITEWYEKRLKSIANANEDAIVFSGKGGVGEKEMVGVSAGKNTWNQRPGEKERGLSLPDAKNGAVQELFWFSQKKEVTKDQVTALWNIFKIQNFDGVKFYGNESEAYSHFINWSKTQQINGTHQQSAKSNPRTAGAEELLSQIKSDRLSNSRG